MAIFVERCPYHMHASQYGFASNGAPKILTFNSSKLVHNVCSSLKQHQLIASGFSTSACVWFPFETKRQY